MHAGATTYNAMSHSCFYVNLIAYYNRITNEGKGRFIHFAIDSPALLQYITDIIRTPNERGCMSPKGNRTGTDGRPRVGGTPKVGGPKSKGSAVKPIRFSLEMVRRIEKRIGRGSFSDYVRECVEKDLTN